MKKMLNGIFAAGLLMTLLAAFAVSNLVTKDANVYENRPAALLPVFSIRDVLDGTFQDSLESALHDQLPAAQRLEKAYQGASNALTLRSIAMQSKAAPDQYYGFRDLMLYHNNVVVGPTFPKDKMEEITARADGLNAIIDGHPELSFYVYYVTKDNDIDFTKDRPTGLSDALFSKLHLSKERMAAYPVQSFDAFRSRFFKTDHHWNCNGSYEGYLHVLSLLGKQDPLKSEGKELVVSDFVGSRATLSGATGQLSEPFYANRFSFPEMTVTVNGAPSDYGVQGLPWDKAAQGPISYGGYYGGDFGEVCFETRQTGAGRLLVLGDSYDNAILKLLASHFEALYAVDLRAFETDMGKPFRFSEYCAEHDIDTVLFIGSMSYFLLEQFCPEG